MLALGPERLLAQRAVEGFVAAARDERPDAQYTNLGAGDLDVGTLTEITGASLFASSSIVVITDLDMLPLDVVAPLVTIATDPGDDLALALTHPGGVKGRGVADKLKKAHLKVVDCPVMRPWEVPRFVIAEAKRAGGRIEEAAAAALVDAVGSDLRTVASAVSQLLDDVEANVITVADVRRYFGGRSEVTSFGVADDVMAGKVGDALAKLRWALATGVSPVMVTSALANSLRALGKYLDLRDSHMRDAELARVVGVPPWKLKSLAGQARTWPQGAVAQALQQVATADAQVKGAAVDPEFALERLVMQVGELRRPVSGRR